MAQKSLLKRLYGEESPEEKRDDDCHDLSRARKKTMKENLRDKIEKRKDFNASYCIYVLVSCFKSLCCCFTKCCSTARCRRHLESHKKMQIAQDRLNLEHDIQHLIEMNRATRLLYKTRFFTRQRRILAYLHRYVISTEDITRVAEQVPAQYRAESTSVQKTDAEVNKFIEFLIDGFDAASNDIDRRIYYEVTGRQLIEGEYEGEDTSDDEWGYLNKPDPLAHAFDYRGGGHLNPDNGYDDDGSSIAANNQV